MHHHCLWQVEFLQLPQEEHPLLSMLGEGAVVQFPLEVLGEDSASEISPMRVLSSANSRSHRCVFPASRTASCQTGSL